ncbi:hypothetical protein [Sphingopyxis sp.]|uniref:hypothetical protein n=1 Tax=Sphingopyxis sp. TaxID=1908224 RepID=UPI00311FD3C3
MPRTFENSIFINCAFDQEFAPILQAVAFCAIHLGFYPRIAPENADNAVPRIDRIAELISSSKYGIHDLSRCRSTKRGEFARMNMPFELGMDYGAKTFGPANLQTKSILVLEGRRYDFQKTLSDIAGWDIEPHGGKYREAMRHVRGWLIDHADAPNIGLAAIEGKYAAFQEWYYERELANGAAEDDIKLYPTITLIRAMHEWKEAGEPTEVD